MRDKRLIDITGMRFGSFTVVALEPKKGNAMWLCRCDCGNLRSVSGGQLRAGRYKSCGCGKFLRSQSAGNGCAPSASPEYGVWEGMHTRCGNPKHVSYWRYGGRGVSVCERWTSFDAFFADMGPRPSPSHSIERIDTNGDYEPGNCRWATVKEQQRNRRNNVVVTYMGVTACVAELCDVFSCPRSTIYAAVKSGIAVRHT